MVTCYSVVTRLVTREIGGERGRWYNRVLLEKAPGSGFLAVVCPGHCLGAHTVL